LRSKIDFAKKIISMITNTEFLL